MRIGILLIVSILFMGCGAVTHYAKRPDSSQIAMGMSQQEVVTILGKPEDISAQGDITYLTYAP